MDQDALTSRRAQYVAELEEDLESLLRQLGGITEVQRVILFGSYAAGRRDLLTDLDLLVVMDSPLDFPTRNAEMARLLHARVAMDLLVYTPAELERARERPFVRHALATGKVLYERPTA